MCILKLLIDFFFFSFFWSIIQEEDSVVEEDDDDEDVKEEAQILLFPTMRRLSDLTPLQLDEKLTADLIRFLHPTFNI